MDNEKKNKITSGFFSIQTDETKQLQTYIKKLKKVPLPSEVASCLQIENKIRMALRREMAAKIPPVE
jgi:hypothetical protein